MNSTETVIIVISAAFAVIAGLMAYLIAYEEYAHHFPDPKQSRQMAFESAVFAFTFFFGLGLILALMLPRLV
ncbi:MAG TPA: hypothetical protein VJ983_05385 [candidate division Zixibacteria bacterium]|nr:hypothetical protein [candidate division Zixibacteria bacterium]